MKIVRQSEQRVYLDEDELARLGLGMPGSGERARLADVKIIEQDKRRTLCLVWTRFIGVGQISVDVLKEGLVHADAQDVKVPEHKEDTRGTEDKGKDEAAT